MNGAQSQPANHSWKEAWSLIQQQQSAQQRESCLEHHLPEEAEANNQGSSVDHLARGLAWNDADALEGVPGHSGKHLCLPIVLLDQVPPVRNLLAQVARKLKAPRLVGLPSSGVYALPPPQHTAEPMMHLSGRYTRRLACQLPALHWEREEEDLP